MPQWLPAGSGTDQAAIMLLGLLPSAKNDAANYCIYKKTGRWNCTDATGRCNTFSLCMYFSWENTWHAYASDQAYAFMKAGEFFNDTSYTNKGIAEVKNFYPWLLQNGINLILKCKMMERSYQSAISKVMTRLLMG